MENSELADKIPTEDKIDIVTRDYNQLYLYNPQPSNSVLFYGEGNSEIGRLTWENGEIEFTGNASESAKIFFDHIKHLVDEHINYKLNKD